VRKRTEKKSDRPQAHKGRSIYGSDDFFRRLLCVHTSTEGTRDEARGPAHAENHVRYLSSERHLKKNEIRRLSFHRKRLDEKRKRKS